MNLYKITCESVTVHKDYTVIEYVAANNLLQVARTFPTADKVELIKESLTIIKQTDANP